MDGKFKQAQMLNPGDLIVIGPTILCLVERTSTNLSPDDGSVYRFHAYGSGGITEILYRAWYEEVWVSNERFNSVEKTHESQLALKGLEASL